MIGKEFYDDVATIIQRVSSKTDNMKTNNLIMLNKVSSEMNDLLRKAQDVIQICLTERKNFMKDVESIQNDFVELSKKMEVRQAFEKSQTICESPSDLETSPRESKLQKMFGDSDSDEDLEANEAARKSVIFNLNKGKKAAQEEQTLSGRMRVPETLALEYLEEFVPEPPSKQVTKPQVLSNQKGFTILETMDPRDEEFNHMTRSSSRMDSISKKLPSSESIVSAVSSASKSDSSSKTPKKSATTPRKHPGTTPNKQAAIVNSNKKIDQFFKKKDSPKGAKTPQIRSITADLNAVRKTSASQEGAGKTGMATRSHQDAGSKLKSVFDVGEGDKDGDEDLDFEETYVEEPIHEEPKEQLASVDLNVKQESLSYPHGEDQPENRKNSASKRGRNKAPDSDQEGNENRLESDQDFFADYDKVPKKKSDSPGYKHVEVVRNKDKRKKLGTSTCRECETYWNSIPEGRRPKRMDEACRHRAKYQAPATPEHYWEVDFPTTQQCIERGYGGAVLQNDNDDSIAARRPRRKRPLNLITNRKAPATDEDGLDFDN